MITIIDAPCGTGKTSWAIQQMNEHLEQPVIFCTPLLEEIERIKAACPSRNFQEPIPYNGSKLNSFNCLVAQENSIAVSHTLFSNATRETLDRIIPGKYTLILDEQLSFFQDFNKTSRVQGSPRQSISDGDMKLLLAQGIVKLDDKSRLSWMQDMYKDMKFSELTQIIETHEVYSYRGILLALFPEELLRKFTDIYILTYMSLNSEITGYLDYYGMEYQVMSVVQVDGRYELVPYNAVADMAFRRLLCDQVTVYAGNSDYNRRYDLSKSWYQRAKAEQFIKLKNSLRSYYEYHLKDARASNGDIMWTCPADYMKKVAGKGYTRIRAMTKRERSLPERERKEVERSLSCFVSCNAKATNVYNKRWALAYCCNIFQNPILAAFFRDNGIAFDEDAYSLSCLIQWMCRSRIRNGEPIEIYLPSKRMRDLFLDWRSVGSSTSE